MSVSSLCLPALSNDDPRRFKSSLELGTYKFRVVKVTDISQPAAKPIDEIEEDENETANENRLNQNTSRMLRLELRDSKNTAINALEHERIAKLDKVGTGWEIVIKGPADIRCGYIMMEPKNVQTVEQPQVVLIEDWDEDDEDDCIVIS